MPMQKLIISQTIESFFFLPKHIAKQNYLDTLILR